MEFVNAITGYIGDLGVANPSVPDAKKSIHMMLQAKNGTYGGKVRISEVGMVNADEYVDLELPSGLLWATKNLGATNETEFGWFCAWGDKKVYENASAKNAGNGRTDGFSSAAYNASEAALIETDIPLANDPAHIILGNRWRMPTNDDFIELFDNSNTTREFVENYNGIANLRGVVVTSVRNLKRLFLPCGGRIYGNSRSGTATGYYYSSSRHSNSLSYGISFSQSTGIYANVRIDRYYGCCVKPVIKL